MSVWSRFLGFWDTSGDSPELVRAQYDVLTRQIPAMYAILVANMAILSFMHVGRVPDWLTIHVPVAFSVICFVRALRMISARRNPPPDAALRRQFRTMMVLLTVMGVTITGWSLVLFSLGDALTRSQVTFFSGITIIVVITSMMPLRQAGLIMFLAVCVPNGIFLALQDEPVYRAIAVNEILVIGAMLAIFRRSQQDFRQRIAKQIELDAQRRELEALNARISTIANQDSLTGLPNRRCFFEHLDRMIGEDNGSSGGFAVALIDLDGFKPVNDIHGHGIGDRLLREVGQRFRAALPRDAVLARIGGDEFAVILPRPGDDEALRRACGALLAALAPSFDLEESSAAISATCGVARYPEAGRTGQALFERADFALYYSKEHGRGAVTIFSDFHEKAIKEAAVIGQRLREADLAATMFLEYQPIVDGRSGDVLGMEALARWQDPVLGKVRPDIFIRAAEQAGQIGRVTALLFDKAVAEASAWPAPLYLSFNLSAHDLCSPETMAALFETIRRTGFQPSRLVFEITESAVMQDFSRAIGALEDLRKAGCALALDDFGTGYSSLSYVRRLPIDRIKVDRSFVQDIERDKVARNVLKTIADLCNNLGFQCIVEGVETHTQLQILAQTGCTGYQGYLFARPMTAARLGEWLREQRELRRVG